MSTAKISKAYTSKRRHDREENKWSKKKEGDDDESRDSKNAKFEEITDVESMDDQCSESVQDPNETSEQSNEQIETEGEHEDKDPATVENAVVIPESQQVYKVFKGDVPFVGMIFESETESYDYYNAYARSMGFSIRKSKMVTRRDKTITRRILCCSKEGFRCKHPRGDPMKPRPVTRTGCKAKFGIHLQNGIYVVNEFEEEHNHPLARPTEAHMLRSQKKNLDTQAFNIEDILSYIREEAGAPQDLNLAEGDNCNNYLQRWCCEILKKSQEDKKKIKDLSAELQRERRQSAAYREQLDAVLKEMDDHTNHISKQVESVVNNIKHLEARGSKGVFKYA
ncbi:hypothetical protein GIB67_040749 [Kingdonia uniflora]|uniref:FAR1 domain-containing protein n=1 Tax=Kingdonia uniflora TaxID=39325 RepID=A0A7J7KUF2_9MAGN|nr:hypothetical protein GIB67_040749 [Kingdonia uniflora]